jgi:hypothetical protein
VADIEYPDGRKVELKLEGVESRLDDPRRLDVVADLDRADEPALIGELVFSDA